MLDENSTLHSSPFDAIRHLDENGNKYWSARELYKVLGYSTGKGSERLLSVLKLHVKSLDKQLQIIFTSRCN